MTGAGVIVAAVGILLVGLFYFVLLYALGECLGLQLAIEENTRMSAALLLKMHQDTQPAPLHCGCLSWGFCQRAGTLQVAPTMSELVDTFVPPRTPVNHGGCGRGLRR